MNTNKNSFNEPAKIIRRDDAPEQPVYALTFKEAVTSYFKAHFSKKAFDNFVKDAFPHKSDDKREKIRKTVMDISFVLLVVALAYIVFYYFGYRERISDLNNWEVVIENFNEDELNDYEKEKLWENIKRQYPDVEFPEGMSLKFASLYAVNQDTLGVLSIPEKNLWTPILQSKNNPTYYLWKDIYGDYNRYGNPYVDYRCNVGKDTLSTNTIIYGHNTHDKLGFNKLTTYMTLDGYKEAPVITVETLYEKTQWKIFGVMLTNSTSAADRGHLFSYLITDFASSNDFKTMLNGVAERTMIKTGVDVNTSDKILTLYTCYQDIFEGGRLVIFARLVREGESAEVDTSKAYFNHSARYPQAYYDQLGLTNPYEKLTTPIDIETGESTTKPSQENKTEQKTESQSTAKTEQNEPSATNAEQNTTEIGEVNDTTENVNSETQATPSQSESNTAAQEKPSEVKTTAEPPKTTQAAKQPENTSKNA